MAEQKCRKFLPVSHRDYLLSALVVIEKEMSSVMDSLTSRLTATTISSASKAKPRQNKGTAGEDSLNSSKKSSRLIPANCGFKLGSLRSRIGMGTVPKMIAAEKINHETDEGRKEFYYQVCYLIQKKLNVSV